MTEFTLSEAEVLRINSATKQSKHKREIASLGSEVAIKREGIQGTATLAMTTRERHREEQMSQSPEQGEGEEEIPKER